MSRWPVATGPTGRADHEMTQSREEENAEYQALVNDEGQHLSWRS